MLQKSAEESSDRARRESSNAAALQENAKKYIENGIAVEKRRLDQQTEEILKSKKTLLYGQISFYMIGLSFYCFVITMLWITNYTEVLITIPDWFINRFENLASIGNGLISIHSWAYNLLIPHMSKLIAKAIPFIIIVVIMGAIAYFGILQGLCWVMVKWHDLWNHYYYAHQKTLKTCVTISIIIASIPLAIFLTDLFQYSITVISWWLILSILLNVLYHKLTYKW